MRIFKLLMLNLLIVSCQSKEIKNNIIPKDIVVEYVTDLNSKVDETSGIINFNNKLITHNDGGDLANLYELNKVNGEILRTVNIANATNVDMEDITHDDKYIYVCDIGNNSNNRNDQVIYKIKKSDYLNNNEVEAEKIWISYNEQIDYNTTNRNTNFDAEAVVNIGDKLFLFTKNWGDLQTSVYLIPKLAGVYELTKLGTYDIKGLITGATYDKKSNTIVLTGYNNFLPFIVRITNFSMDNPLNGNIEKIRISVDGSMQIEGITANPDGSFYLTAEELSGSPAVLYKMTY